jgi:hypothetical protein
MLSLRYVNFDDTRVAKGRAANGQRADVVDWDSRGKKVGQLAAVSTAGFFAQFVYPCDQRELIRVAPCPVLPPLTMRCHTHGVAALTLAITHPHHSPRCPPHAPPCILLLCNPAPCRCLGARVRVRVGVRVRVRVSQALPGRQDASTD